MPLPEPEYVLESSLTRDEHRVYLEHIAEKYLDRALEEYDSVKGTPNEPRVIIAMINSLADRLAMVEARAKND